MFLRVPEAHSRSLVKAVTWRVVGSLDTFLIAWIVTGQLKYAGIILGVETFTKIGIYYLHEQFWAWVPLVAAWTRLRCARPRRWSDAARGRRTQRLTRPLDRISASGHCRRHGRCAASAC